MTESQLITLADADLVRLVMHNKTFHLVTRCVRFCSPQQAGAAMIGHVRVWCLTNAKWITIDPQLVFAHEALSTPPAPVPD